jgi:hypothetical protein
MPETIPISPDLISTRASEASEESIRAGARNARLREGRLRRSEAAIPSETYNARLREGKGGDGAREGGLRFCATVSEVWDREK